MDENTRAREAGRRMEVAAEMTPLDEERGQGERHAPTPADWAPIRAPARASADGFVRGLRSSWGTEVWLSRSADLSLSLYSHQEFCSATRAIDMDVINWVIGLT